MVESLSLRLDALIVAGLGLFSAFILWQYNPVEWSLEADPSFFLYVGQQILRGHAPYASVGIVKTPLGAFVAALGIGLGRIFGLDDIVGGRLAFLFAAMALTCAIFLVGKVIAGRMAGIFSAVVFLGFQPLGVQVADGPEPKIVMMLFGMLSLALIARRSWFWAGLCAALAFLTWQPGLIFVALSLFCVIWETRGQKKNALLRASLGVAVPLLLVGMYLALNNALILGWQQTIGANLNYFQRQKVAVGAAGVLESNRDIFWVTYSGCLNTEQIYVQLSLLGAASGTAYLGWRLVRYRRPEDFLRFFPVLTSGAVLVGFSLVDFQGCSDVMSLLPFMALAVGCLVWTVIHWIGGRAARSLHWNEGGLIAGAAIVVLLGFFFYGLLDTFSIRAHKGLATERALAASIAARLSANDRIQQFGDTVLLVILNRENATRFIHLGKKQGRGITTAEGIEVGELIQLVQQADPRVITLGRAKTEDWAEEIVMWVRANYAVNETYSAAIGEAKRTEVYWKK